jgi:hypothetical protein
MALFFSEREKQSGHEMPVISVCRRQTKRSKRKAALNLGVVCEEVTSSQTQQMKHYRASAFFRRGAEKSRHPLRSAALNGIDSGGVSPSKADQKPHPNFHFNL